MRAQAGLNVGHGNLLVEGSEGGSHGGGGVAMHEHHIGALRLQHGAHAQQDAGRHVVEVLPRLHDVEVVVGGDGEEAEDLVEHLAVLTGDAHHCAEMGGIGLQGLDERGHLDGFGASAENEHHFLHRR